MLFYPMANILYTRLGAIPTDGGGGGLCLHVYSPPSVISDIGLGAEAWFVKKMGSHLGLRTDRMCSLFFGSFSALSNP